MKRKMKSLLAGIIAAVLLITGGFAAYALIFSGGQKAEEFLDGAAILSAGYTENDVSAKEYTLMLENDGLQLWMNRDTTEFKVVNKKDSSQWYSTNQGRSDGSAKSALFNLSYMDDKGNLASMDAMNDAVLDGKFDIVLDKSTSTLKVRYSVGKFSNLVMIPYALTEERFDEIIGSLDDEFEQMKLQDIYYLTDIAELDDTLKSQRLSEYPLLKDQKLYIIRDAVKENSATIRDIAALFTEAGYTEEDYESDSKYFRANATSKIEPGFNITIEYSLSENGLTVRIPQNELQMYNEFPMTSLTLFPYFGSPERETEGWFFLPDGSGSIMNFYNGKGNGQLYRSRVYGDDLAQDSREKISVNSGASLPVFGIKSDDSAVFCEITEGAAVANITAYPGDNSEFAYVNTAFDIRAVLKSRTTTGRKEAFYIVQKGRYQGDIAMKFHFLDGDNASLSGMAKTARKSIFGDKQPIANALPVLVEQVGLISRQNQFLGISYNEKAALTSFNQAESVAEEFLNSGVKDLSLKLMGWFGNGIDHAFPSGEVKASSQLGGKSGLLSLIDAMNSKNIPLYLDADIQYTAKSGGSYNKSAYALTMLDQSVGQAYKYDPSSFMRTWNRTRYINNAAAQKKALENIKATLNNLNTKNLSLRSIGAELSGDYGAELVDRQAMANKTGGYLKELSESDWSILTQGANAYALPYITQATNVPVTSAGFDNIDLSVPFLSMVLDGYVNYYAPAVNLSGDFRTEILQAISAGAGFSCILTADNSHKTAGSDQSYLYSTNFDYWKDILPAEFADCQKRLEPVSGSLIVGYEQLAQGVFSTIYDNGKAVVVNYNSRPYTYKNTVIDAKDFAVKEAAE